VYESTLTAVGIVACVVVAHEALHLLGYQLFGIKARFKIIWWHRFPYAFAVESDYFAGTYKSLPANKRAQYSIIAGMPYVVILPICVYWSYSDIPIVGWLVGVAHIINWPLEYGI